jgi:hypothetical protein
MLADELQRHAAALLCLSFDCQEPKLAEEVRKIAGKLIGLANDETPSRISDMRVKRSR